MLSKGGFSASALAEDAGGVGVEEGVLEPARVKMLGTLVLLDGPLAVLLPEVARAANFALFCSRILAARSLISASSGLSCLTITPPAKKLKTSFKFI